MDSFSHDPFDASAESLGSQRAWARDSLFLTAQLTFAGELTVREVRVRNLSEGGLMVDCARVKDPGTAVTLTMRGIGKVGGKVAWCTEGRIGIALDAPIDPKLARKPVGGGAGE